MKRYVTIFPNTLDIHLIKDVGMIPYMLYKYHGYDAYIATYNNGKYDYLDSEVKGLKLDFIKKKFNNDYINIILYIVKNAKKIDVLQVFGFSISQLFLLMLYKIISGKENKAYIKLDSNETILEIKYSWIRKKIIQNLVQYVDVITAETHEIAKQLEDNNTLFSRVQYLPNGFFDNEVKREISFNKKKNQFITVGRLSLEGKQIFVLLEGFAKFVSQNPKNDFSFVLIGPYDDDFSRKFELFIKSNSLLADRIVLTGPIYDRKKLQELYLESKIFLFASLSESFGFVYLEALQNGCFIISTPLLPAFEISDNGKYANFFDFGDSSELSKIIENTIKKEDLFSIAEKGSLFVYENFYWPKIANKLVNYLNLKK